MDNDYNFTVNDRRELDKMGLETFTFNKSNMFEASANSIIKKLTEENDKSMQEHQSWVKIYQKEPQRWTDLQERAENVDIDIERQMFDYIIDVQYRNEELVALTEMKIIYLYRFFEINIKQLLRAAFSLNSVKDFYKWDELINFIKNKNITPSDIPCFLEILQIKDVNNALKHHGEIDEKLKRNIPEFKNSTPITYREFEAFYERVKSSPISFLQKLSDAIYTELYEFDDTKIERIAHKVALRMDKKNALKLIAKIKSQY